ALAKCAKAVSPMAYGAFEENRQFGARLSRAEIDALRTMLRGEPCPLKGRVKREFLEKLDISEDAQPKPDVESGQPQPATKNPAQ
ncbi:hypothetical protein IIC65_07255, partial [Candidatus Sumerlaeota bacterium]|nr:hypothetical protein [Candidatus Sumerlaeota bacterium]